MILDAKKKKMMFYPRKSGPYIISVADKHPQQSSLQSEGRLYEGMRKLPVLHSPLLEQPLKRLDDADRPRLLRCNFFQNIF